MQIENNRVVTINYTLTDNDGTVIDQSQDSTFSYLHGSQNIIPGLEDARSGKRADDKLQVTITPENAYGERDDSQVQAVPREMFPTDVEIAVGMTFHAEAPNGEPITVMVSEVAADTVTVDGNHPLAGQTLNFDVEVVDVRDAAPEELDHGHVHGPGGHQHD